MEKMNLKVGRVLTATVEMDNSSDESRAYGVAARVDMSGDTVTTIHNGTVTDTGDGAQLAEFNTYNGIDTLSVSYSKSEGRGAILDNVERFIASAKGSKLCITAVNNE